jgi:hypothetical protein
MKELFDPFLAQLVQLLLQFLVFALLVLVTIIWRQVRPTVLEWLNSKTTEAQRALLARLAQEAAIYVQGKWMELEGPARLEKAVEHLYEEAHKHGIPLTQESGMAAIKAGYEQARAAGMLPGKAPRYLPPTPAQEIAAALDKSTSKPD